MIWLLKAYIGLAINYLQNLSEILPVYTIWLLY